MTKIVTFALFHKKAPNILKVNKNEEIFQQNYHYLDKSIEND